MNLPSTLLILSIAAFMFNHVENQIINGFDASRKDFPYKVAIYLKGQYVCGAGIIDATHVITAAHCVHGFAPSELMIVAGVTDLNHPMRILRFIKKIHVPKEFPNNRRNYDISVLTLNVPFSLSEDIAVAPLIAHDISNNRTLCWFTGWGLPHEALSRDYELKLKWTPLTIIETSACECIIRARLPTNLLCAIDTKRSARTAIVRSPCTPKYSANISTGSRMLFQRYLETVAAQLYAMERSLVSPPFVFR